MRRLLLSILAVPVAIAIVAVAALHMGTGRLTGASWLSGPESLIDEAQQAFDDGDAAKAGGLARAALEQDPYLPGGFYLLGLIADQQGDAGAIKLMRTAGDLSWRSTASQFWLFNRLLERGEYGPAFESADSLLRRRIEWRVSLFPSMIAAAADGAASDALAERLRLTPNWRPLFMETFAKQANGKTMRTFLGALGEKGADATPQELGFFLQALTGQGEYLVAKALKDGYAMRSAPGQKLLVAGDLTDSLSPLPFNWDFRTTVGGRAEIQNAPGGGGRALRAKFDGYHAAVLSQQLLTLQPGDYKLGGAGFDFSSEKPGLAKWQIECADSPQVLGQVGGDLAGRNSWRPFEARFSVPEEQCAAQWLRLVIVPGERRSSNELWFDNLKITPN